MLISRWSEIVSKVLNVLTESERNALLCEMNAVRGVGVKALAQSGFMSKQEYETTLAAAKEHFRLYLSEEYDVTALTDLAFEEKSYSSEGRIIATKKNVL